MPGMDGLRGLPAHPPDQAGPGHHADRPRRRGRSGGRPRAGRRRLRRRSRSRRASCWRGCARCCGARSPAAVAERDRRRARRDRRRRAARARRRRARRADRARVRHPAGAGAAAGRVVPRETLLAQAGRDDVTVSDRTVDVHVSHLRRKLGDDSKSPRLIKTVRGVGYVLAAPDGRARETRMQKEGGGERAAHHHHHHHWHAPPHCDGIFTAATRRFRGTGDRRVARAPPGLAPAHPRRAAAALRRAPAPAPVPLVRRRRSSSAS